MNKIYITTDRSVSKLVDKADKDIVKAVISEILTYEGLDFPATVNVLITNNRKIRKLNQLHREIDRETDVLSFPLLTFDEHFKTEEMMPYHMDHAIGKVPIGDIVISFEKAKSQAEEYGHSLTREMAFLTAHSVYHLLGLDHMSKKDERKMNEKVQNILQKMKILRVG